MILLVLFFTAEDVVNSTTKYIMFDRGEDVSSTTTYPVPIQIEIYMESCEWFFVNIKTKPGEEIYVFVHIL